MTIASHKWLAIIGGGCALASVGSAIAGEWSNCVACAVLCGIALGFSAASWPGGAK